MRQQMATVMGLGLSGVPYSGPDIGGFSGVPDDELYVRWLQMSVLLPYCRTHSVLGSPGREPWRFAEPARSTIVAWLRFRYRLLPYLYTLAHQAATTGAPLVRPLWWPDGADAGGSPGAADGAEDEAVVGAVDDAFLLGRALLVAPVTTPGTTARRVPVPSGRWVSVWAGDGSGGRGPGVVALDAPSRRTPVLVRTGSVVPLDDGWTGRGDSCRVDADGDLDTAAPAATGANGATGANADTSPAARASPGPGGGAVLDLAHTPRRLAFHCWPTESGDAQGTCIDDAGDGHGPVRRDRVRLVGAVPGGTAVLTWERDGDFPPPTAVRIVVHGLTIGSITADGASVATAGSSVETGPFSELRMGQVGPVQEGRP
jgi:alpha-glucosidase